MKNKEMITQTDKFSGYLNKFFLIRNVMVQKIE